MAQCQFLDSQGMVRAATEARQACERVLSEMAETRAATQKIIHASRELMAAVEVDMAKRRWSPTVGGQMAEPSRPFCGL